MFAEYPPNVAINIGAPKANAKDKGKGKQREDVELDGLLPISQRETPNPSGSPITDPGPWHPEMRNVRPSPSGRQIPGLALDTVEMNNAGGTTHNHISGQLELDHHRLGQDRGQQGHGRADELVRIDMRQMVMLKNLGHELLGPVNGPNEGLPQYEVPRSWLQELENLTIINSDTDPGPSNSRPYPRPRPLKKTLAPVEMAPIIDPALVCQAQVPTEHQENVPADMDGLIDLRSGSDPVLTSNDAAKTDLIKHVQAPIEQVPPNLAEMIGIESGSGPGDASGINTATVLGKRSIVVRSPPRQAQAQKPQRRKSHHRR